MEHCFPDLLSRKVGIYIGGMGEVNLNKALQPLERERQTLR